VNNYPGKINLAILDHIISTPGLVLPVDSLALFFAEKGIPLFIDGAHAIGQIPVDMAEIKANAYFSNFHKWSFAPKNAAFLYLDDKYVEIVKPVITGNFHGMGPER
jgi:selenocysteine lyase/cysteine desulfurase